MTRHPSTGDLCFVVSNKEVLLPPWKSALFFLSLQCGRKNTDIEQAGEKDCGANVKTTTGFSVNK